MRAMYISHFSVVTRRRSSSHALCTVKTLLKCSSIGLAAQVNVSTDK